MVYCHVFNEEGIEAFLTFDNDHQWRTKPRPVGRYVSTAWIPGNLLAEGMYFLGPGVYTLNPEVKRVRVDDAVAIQVIDGMDGNGARVDYRGNIAGVLRPFLNWETKFFPNTKAS